MERLCVSTGEFAGSSDNVKEAHDTDILFLLLSAALASLGELPLLFITIPIVRFTAYSSQFCKLSHRSTAYFSQIWQSTWNPHVHI